jgi:hypothetical protein
VNSEYKNQELAVRRELAMLEYANREKVSLETIRADLAKESMRLNVQTQLSEKALAVDTHKHAATIKADLHKSASEVSTPPTEPAGKAEPGQSYAQ